MSGKSRQEIITETEFIFTFILNIFKLPITLILVLFGKKQAKELLVPFEQLVHFFTSARFVSWIIIITTTISIVAAFLPSALFNTLLVFPSDLLTPIRWFSFLTSGFIHANAMHLLGNMLALFIFGRIVERKLGSLKTASMYFAAMCIASIGYSFFGLFILGNNTPALGASGAIMGLVSAAILLNPFYITYDLLLPLPVMVVGWLTLYADYVGVLSANNDGVGHLAHLLGFFSIGLSMFLLESHERKHIKKGFLINIFSLIVFVVLTIVFQMYF